MTRTKKRTTKNSVALLFLGIALVAAQAQKKPEPYALVRGTVFQESGRALPGAKIVLAAKAKPEKKLQEQVANSQGEFAFRLPAVRSEFILTASLKGFQTATREVEVVGQEEINKTLTLVPASN